MLSRTVTLADIDDLPAAARARARAARRHLSDTGAVHCLYHVGPQSVVRWTADGSTVTRDVLATPSPVLRQRTTDLLTALANDPGATDAPVPAPVASDLARLATDLLPSRVLAPGGAPRRLFITGDGFLAQLPFAALNVGSAGSYDPLVARTVIVWCRHGLAPADANGRETVQVAGDPVLNAAIRRRFALPADLPGAHSEIQRVAARFPGLATIEGAAATSDRVEGLWDAADVFYFVGHAISDVQVPFAVWLPLSTGDDGATYPGIGMQDVLGHDFKRCRVVVLSGCATGRPYVDGLSTAPSLGDAFLDAGARATIQTFWPVRDEDAAIAPERIVAAWRDQRQDLATALAMEQRRVMAGPAGIRHPFSWAAWTVALGGATQGGR